VASLHAQWRNKPSKKYEHKKYANIKPDGLAETFPVKTYNYYCSIYVKAKKGKKNSSQSSTRKCVTYNDSYKQGCNAFISKVLITDSTTTVMYHWHHPTHDPYSMEDLQNSCLPAELKSG
jgi:hypothetical protein